MVFYSPKLDIKKLVTELETNRNVSGTKIKAWLTVLRILSQRKRLIKVLDSNLLESCKPKNNLISDSNLCQSLRKRVYSFSHKDHKTKDSLFDIPIFGKTDDFAINKIDEFFKYSRKSRLIKFKGDFISLKAQKVNLFYDYLAAYFCFYDTFIIWDRYIIDRKFGGLLTAELASRFEKLQNFVIITDNPFIQPARSTFFGNESRRRLFDNEIKDKLFSWYTKVKAIFNSNIPITFFLIDPNKMKTIHSRFYGWASIGNSYRDHLTLNTLINNIHMAMRSDKGDEPFDINFKNECLLTCDAISVDEFNTNLEYIMPSPRIINDNYFQENKLFQQIN